MRVTRAEINSKNLIHNLQNIRKTAPNSEVLAMVKANAYGHGIVETAKILRENNVNYLGVAFADEAVVLRNNGDSGNIVVILPATKSDAEVIVKNNLQTCLADIHVAKYFSEVAVLHKHTIPAHLFINTGMNRDGIKPEEAEDFLRICSTLSGINIIGIMTHFSSSDFSDKSFAHKQLDTFTDLISNLKSKKFSFQFVHSANSGAIVNIPDSHFNMIRPGISLYGYLPEKDLHNYIDLKQVLSLKTEVLSIKRVNAGETAGYSFKYFADDIRDLAIIPIGYGDGINYSLTNKAKCIINNKLYNIVGSICMDQSIVDLGMDSGVKIGDEVTLIGSQGEHSISAYDIAKKINSIPYDITTSISMRVPRSIT